MPKTFDELVKLPGVGRKTANVLVSVLYDTPAIAVDTHVFRVANRMTAGCRYDARQCGKGSAKSHPR